MNDLLRQLAIHQADVEFELQKAQLARKQEEELRSVDAELEELESLSQQMQLAGTTEPLTAVQVGSSQPAEGDACMNAGMSPETAEGAQQGEEGQQQISTETRPAEEAGGSPNTLGGNVDGATSVDCGNEDQEAPLHSRQEAAADKRRQLELALATGDIKAAQAQLMEEYRERLRQAETANDQERLIQDQRAQQLVQERRQRLLEKKARLQAEQQKALEELEKEKQVKLDRLQQELQQDLVDFSIEFEVEPHELDKLARQLWTESHQRYQQQLREMEKRQAHAMEDAYDNFIKDWATHHDGEADVSIVTAILLIDSWYADRALVIRHQ